MQDGKFAESIRFVVSEVDRLSELYQRDWKSAVDQSEISRGMPSEHVQFPQQATNYYRCGKVAEQQLFEAVDELVENDPDLSGQTSTQTVFETLQVEIVRNCIEQKQPVTVALTSNLFEKAKRASFAKRVDRTYFFPVFAIRTDADEELSVGAAKLVRTKSFFEK